jgi:PST family polysaccharide transporter
VLARHISPSEWGTAAFAVSALGLALAIGQFGLSQAIVHISDLSDAHVSAASLSAWIWSGACALIFLGLGAFLEKITGIRDLRLYMYALAPCIIIRAVGGIAEGKLLREKRFSSVSIIDFGSYAAGYVGTGICLGMWGGGTWALVCAHIGWAVTRLAGLACFAGFDLWTMPKAPTFEEILPFARGQTLAQSANYIATESDNIIVGAALGPSALGAYGRAYSLAVAPANLLSAAIDKVFYPNLASLRRADASLASMYLLGTELAVALALPSATLAIVAAPEIVTALLGPRWTPAVTPLRVLSLGLLFRALFQLSDCFCRANGDVLASGLRQTVYATLVIGGALVGSLWGVAGVAGGVVFAMAAKYVLMAELSLRKLHIPATRYLASIADGARMGLFVTLAVMITIYCCRRAQSPALLTCVVALIVFLATISMNVWSTTNHKLAAG